MNERKGGDRLEWHVHTKIEIATGEGEIKPGNILELMNLCYDERAKTCTATGSGISKRGWRRVDVIGQVRG
jgi:hypothetical protein